MSYQRAGIHHRRNRLGILADPGKSIQSHPYHQPARHETAPETECPDPREDDRPGFRLGHGFPRAPAPRCRWAALRLGFSRKKVGGPLFSRPIFACFRPLDSLIYRSGREAPPLGSRGHDVNFGQTGSTSGSGSVKSKALRILLPAQIIGAHLSVVGAFTVMIP
jgi:hypothetical protein